MKLAGHTHGVRDMCRDVFEMIDSLAALGFNGLEMAATPTVLSVDTSAQERKRLRSHIAQSGLELVNIACYAGEAQHGFNADDQAVRQKATRDIEDHLRLASDVGSPCMRVFPGGEPGRDGVIPDPQRAFKMSVRGIQNVATVAMDLNVTLLIENHPESIAGSAEQTVRLVEAVARPNVRILYEPSNLLVYAGRDDHSHGFDIQKSWIRHVHIKDQIRKPDGRYDVAVAGRGIVPWLDIVGWLGSTGYDGFLSFELAWTNDLSRRKEELKEVLTHFACLIDRCGVVKEEG